jgi:AcrR family transcriptional regulator
MARPGSTHAAAGSSQIVSRERIVMAARGLMAQHDPAEVDRESIVDAAGVRPEDFDRHFQDMSVLWQSVATAMVRDMADVQRSLYGMRCSVPDRLSRTFEYALDAFERSPDGYRAIRRMVDAPGPAGDHARGMLQGILTEITCQLAVLHGWDEEPELTAQCLYAQLLRIFDHWQAHPEHMTRKRIQTFVMQHLRLGRTELATADA